MLDYNKLQQDFDALFESYTSEDWLNFIKEETNMIIEEKARQYAKKECGYNVNCNIDNTCESCQWFNNHITETQMRTSSEGFIAGYQAALHENRWRDVEKELPENQNIVLVKTDKLCIATAYLHGDVSNFITYGEHAYIDFGKITHWKPITEKL